MIGVLSVIEQWVEEHTPDPSQEGNYPPRQTLPDTLRKRKHTPSLCATPLERESEAEVKKFATLLRAYRIDCRVMRKQHREAEKYQQ